MFLQWESCLVTPYLKVRHTHCPAMPDGELVGKDSGGQSSCNPEQNPFVHNPRAGSRTQSVLGIEGCPLWVATALTKTSSMRLSPNARILSKTILGFCLGATRTHCALRRHWGSERWPSPSVSEVKQLLQDKRTHQDPATQV